MQLPTEARDSKPNNPSYSKNEAVFQLLYTFFIRPQQLEIQGIFRSSDSQFPPP